MRRKNNWNRPRRAPNGKVFQDPMQGAPMEVAPIPLSAPPKMRYGLDYLPGTGYVRIPPPGKANPYRGGIFGQPPMPYGRRGIFKDHWGLPPSMAYDDTGVFTPFQQKRIPGTCMDCGPDLGVAMGLGQAPNGIINDAELIADEAVGEAKGWLKKLGEWMFGPPPAEDPRTTRQVLRDNEKKAWMRAGLIIGVMWYLESLEWKKEGRG